MSQRDMKIVYSSSIDAIEPCNSSFDRGILRVCYTGANRNNSFISKETFERCMPSIYHCPIVCRYDRETDSIGAHDMELVQDENGGLRIVNITQPVGVIPGDSRYWWEEIEDDSGVHEYLCVDALIWKRQEAYRKIKEDGIVEESMEISVKEGEMIDGIYVIKRFEFTAFCLLGSAEPCYEQASLEMFSHENFKQQFAEMMREFKESFSLVQPSDEVVIHSKDYSMEGGEEVLEQKIALMEEFGLTEEALDFSLEEFELDELRARFEEMTAVETDPVEDPVVDPVETQPTENFALTEQFRDELIRSLTSETIETCWGETARYWYVDYDSEIQEVYCHDVEDWNLYGFHYEVNGDLVSVDFASKKRKKFTIVDFDEGEQTALFAAVYNKLVEKYEEQRDANAQWAEKYQTASDTIESMENELGTLRQFKADTEDAIAESEREEVFAQFEDLIGVEAFEALRENRKDYSLEELEEKCFAIRGRNGAVAKFSYEPKAPKLRVESVEPVKAEPYGGVFTEFGIMPKK